MSTPSSDMTQGRQGESTLRTAIVQVERKTFELTVRENARGRFLKITEIVAGHRDSVIVPDSGFAEFRAALNSVLQE